MFDEIILEKEEIHDALQYFNSLDNIENIFDENYSESFINRYQRVQIKRNFKKNQPRKKYLCEICDIYLPNPRELRKHERDYHKIYKCDYIKCENEIFEKYFDLVLHRMTDHSHNKKNIKKEIIRCNYLRFEKN